jgi:hypothetical protein
MKHLKLFEELINDGPLSVEEMSDYFLEFLDTKDIKFKEIRSGSNWDETGHKLLDKTIEMTYEIDEKYIMIKDIETLTKFKEFITTLESICKRWGIKFKLYMNGFRDCEITISQLAPKAITEWVNKYNLLTDTFYGRKSMVTWSSPDSIFKNYGRSLVMDENINYYLYISKFRSEKSSIPPSQVPTYFEKTMGVKFLEKENDSWKFKIPY